MGSKPGGDRTWLWVVATFVIAWTLYLMLFGPRNRGAQTFRPGTPADYAWTLEDLDGAPVEFARFQGKAVFLNLWATWCPPCVAEMPSIARLAANPRLKDVAFVCVSVDADLEPVRRFVGQRGLVMTVLRAPGPIPDVYYTEGVPATFLISPDGRIVTQAVGADDWDRPDVVASLETMAKSAATGPR